MSKSSLYSIVMQLCRTSFFFLFFFTLGTNQEDLNALQIARLHPKMHDLQGFAPVELMPVTAGNLK